MNAADVRALCSWSDSMCKIEALRKKGAKPEDMDDDQLRAALAELKSDPELSHYTGQNGE